MTNTSTGRERVLEQAAFLFLERGYTATTLRVIAAACDVKAGSIYYHFASKAEILTQILLIGLERITEGTQNAVAEVAQQKPTRRLQAAIHGHLAALFEFGPFTAAHVSVFSTAPREVREACLHHRDAYEAIWTQLLDDAAQAGELRSDVDQHIARLALMGAMNMSLQWFRPDGELSIQQLGDAIGAQFLTGVTKR